ncbi:MAG: hypothetical protein CL878_03020 [Dehalococcoidia bacterium]|nr:hypothetical protein [Dehalococcoidia bacterium]
MATQANGDEPRFNFGAGMPDSRSFPSKDLAVAAARVIEREGSSLVRYPGNWGYPGLREIARERFHRNHGVDVPIDDIVLGNGSMQPINLVASAWADSGTPVVVEEYTYSGTLGVFRHHQVDLVPIPLDAQGMQIDALDAALTSLRQFGVPARFIYTIASHQNPSGTTLPVERRRELLEVAARHEVVIVEDDCYADLRYRGEEVPSLYALAEPGHVLYIGSFSKILGPGARLGYFIGPPALRDQLLEHRRDGGTSSLAAMIVAEYLQEHMWSHIAEVKALMGSKLATLHGALDECLGDICTWTQPTGGLFQWLKLPEDVDTARLNELVTQQSIAYGPGRSFDARDRDIAHVRLAFGYIDQAYIMEGVARLADSIRKAQTGTAGNHSG